MFSCSGSQSVSKPKQCAVAGIFGGRVSSSQLANVQGSHLSCHLIPLPAVVVFNNLCSVACCTRDGLQPKGARQNPLCLERTDKQQYPTHTWLFPQVYPSPEISQDASRCLHSPNPVWHELAVGLPLRKPLCCLRS